MTKTKRQLRAEAVERLDSMRLDTGSAVKRIATILGVEWNPDNVPASVGALHNMLRYLLTDDELQEGDAVKELREFIDDQFVSGKTAWTQGMALADMIERDYVRRDTLSCPDCAKELERVTAERDELKSRHCPHYHADKHYCDIHGTRIKELIAERDEWKAKAEQAMESYADAKSDRDAWIKKCKQNFSLITQTANALFPDYQERIAELQEKVDEQRKSLEAAWEDNAELITQVDELTQANADYREEWHRVCRERDELRRELTNSNRERERLRKSLGIAIDHAHDMIALVSLDGDTE